MRRLEFLALAALAFGAPAVSAQDPIEAELDAFWDSVVSSVENWNVDAQQATYHPDAIYVSADDEPYRTSLMVDAFAAVRAGDDAPPIATLAFRFSSRVHGAMTAHEVGVYRFHQEGSEPFYGGLDSYLVKKDGRWTILLEIQLREGLSEAEWDALGTG